jgi:phenylalanyl-tRNA synthetase beta chain
MPDALDAATAMVLDLCGGAASRITEAGAEPHWRRHASLRFDRLKSFGGAEIAPDEAVASLEKLGFTIYRRDGEHALFDVPSWRNDIAQAPALEQSTTLDPVIAEKAAAGAAEIEPEVDLIEEVLRLRGLDAIVPVSLPLTATIPAPILTAKQSRTLLARRSLAARGLMECVTFSFLDHEIAALFNGSDAGLRLANPIAADLDQMRPTAIATLAAAAARNIARGYPDLGLFEIGPAYPAAGSQILAAAGLRTGETPLSALAASRKFDALDAKADSCSVLAALGVPLDAVTASPDAPNYFHPGQSGTLRQGPKIILGHFGTLHPSVCAKLDLPIGAVAFEVFLDAIPEPKRRRKAAPALPAFQPLRRDFAFLVPEATPADALIRAAKGAERNLITNVTLFDRYAGKNLPEGQISLAIAVTLQPVEKSLTEAEIEAVSAKIVAAVAKETGGVLRG